MVCLVSPAFRVRQFIDTHGAAACLSMNRSRSLNGYTRCDADCLSFQKPMTRDPRELGLVEEASVDSP